MIDTDTSFEFSIDIKIKSRDSKEENHESSVKCKRHEYEGTHKRRTNQ